ncbi:MAG: DinB family protein [Anaerolineales bacterium]|nr:DinB family protein [Anaerolineales bacterium]
MTKSIVERLLEHNNWANLRLLEACGSLSDEQLDFQPQSAVHGTIRAMLRHLATSQEDYLWMLTRFDHPPERGDPLSLAELRDVLTQSGGALVVAAQGGPADRLPAPIHLTDGYTVEPWVILTQVINHATEHREQIKSILSALGKEPPRLDGWVYGRQQEALIPPAQP